MTRAPSIPNKPARRPFGLNAIIVLQLLTVLVSGLLLVAAGLAIWVTYGAAQAVGAVADFTADYTADYTADFTLYAVDVLALVLVFVVNLVCAIGLWRRRRWAWYLTMLQLGAFMLADLYSYFTNSPVRDYAWSMLLNVMMVFYLNQRDVRALFMDGGTSGRPATPARL
jgi:uncharacterized membrane protein